MFQVQKVGSLFQELSSQQRKIAESSIGGSALDAEIIVTNDEAKEVLYFLDLELLEGDSKQDDKLVTNFTSSLKSSSEVDTSKSDASVDLDLKETSINDLCSESHILTVIDEVTPSGEVVSSFKDHSVTNEENCSPEEIFLLFEHLDTEFVVDTGASIHVTNARPCCPTFAMGLHSSRV